jgi:hypothetical protein
MKAGLIFARKSTWRSRLDLEYLDETSERKVSQRERIEPDVKKSAIGRNLRQFADYASKESLGQVHAGGFLHHMILANENGTRVAPSELSNEERKKRISEAWFQHIRKFPTSSTNPVIQHRIVFSMSREVTRQTRGGRNQPRPSVAIHLGESDEKIRGAIPSV